MILNLLQMRRLLLLPQLQPLLRSHLQVHRLPLNKLMEGALVLAPLWESWLGTSHSLKMGKICVCCRGKSQETASVCISDKYYLQVCFHKYSASLKSVPFLPSDIIIVSTTFTRCLANASAGTAVGIIFVCVLYILPYNATWSHYRTFWLVSGDDCFISLRCPLLYSFESSLHSHTV